MPFQVEADAEDRLRLGGWTLLRVISPGCASPDKSLPLQPRPLTLLLVGGTSFMLL